MTGRARHRVLVIAAVAAVGITAAALASGGGGGEDYTLYAKFRQAGGLRQGFKVRIDGAPVGKIESLELDKSDLVVAKLAIDKSAAPVGRDVRAIARAADLLGEKFVDLEPGNRSRPAPSGTTIPPSRTGLAVELDDVINALDLPTRQALRAFINEQGAWFVGRHNDLAQTLAALPGALDRTRALLTDFGADNAALGRLVEESDRVVGAIAGQRAALGRFVQGAAGTFDTLGKRNAELAASVREAPATLAATRRALAALERASVPLGPAARGLRETAPQLTATLHELPAFTQAARPALATVRRVSPTLQRLGRNGAPVVRRLQPLSQELATFATAFTPVTKVLDSGIADVLGVLEGWARATQAKDTASHVFRFGLTLGADTFPALADLLRAATKPKAKPKQRDRTPARTLKTPKLTVPKLTLPTPKTPSLPLPKTSVPELLENPQQEVQQLLDFLLAP